MIIGQIFKGVKRMIEFKMLAAEDRQDLATWRANLICRLTVQSREAQENMIRSIREMDKFLN